MSDWVLIGLGAITGFILGTACFYAGYRIGSITTESRLRRAKVRAEFLARRTAPPDN